MLELLGNIGFIVFTAASLLFTFVFMGMSDAWRSTFMGSLIALFLICVDILCIYLGFRVWDIALPGVDWIRFIIFWVLGLTMLSATGAFFYVQFSKRGESMRRRLASKYADLQSEKEARATKKGRG